MCPSARDLAAVAAAGLDARYRVVTAGDDADGEEGFDPDRLLREAEAVAADGVVGTKDRPALLAAIVGERVGLPGPSPRAVLSAQHKRLSRELQRRAAPEAVPRFGDVEPPCFVKPVVGRLSQGAFRLERGGRVPPAAQDAYSESFARMAALAGVDGLDFDGYLREELVDGLEVTLEGYVHRGSVTVVGVTDSVFYPGTRSFQRFEYPSRLGPERLAELGRVAARVLPALGFDGGFFNVEFNVPDAGPAQILEVNARIASQFAPLHAATHGRSSYDALFALACGDDPAWAAGAPNGVAVSRVVRAFADALVEAVPEPEPGLELLVAPGRRLSEQGAQRRRQLPAGDLPRARADARAGPAAVRGAGRTAPAGFRAAARCASIGRKPRHRRRRMRKPLILLGAALATAAVAATAAPAAGDPVAVAKADVAQLQADVASAAATLTADANALTAHAQAKAPRATLRADVQKLRADRRAAHATLRADREQLRGDLAAVRDAKLGAQVKPLVQAARAQNRAALDGVRAAVQQARAALAALRR